MPRSGGSKQISTSAHAASAAALSSMLGTAATVGLPNLHTGASRGSAPHRTTPNKGSRMNTKKLLRIALISAPIACGTAALAGTPAAPAPTVQVSFTVFEAGGFHAAQIKGTFSGADSDLDGSLSFHELSSFNAKEDHPIGFGPLALADLSGFGDYLIGTNEWLNNGESWKDAGNIGWFSWDNDLYSVTPYDAFVSTEPVGALPEPSSIALLAIGTMVLITRRRYPMV